jgi:hypothetical protein
MALTWTGRGAIAGADSGRGGDVKDVQVRDDCDPATFNAVLGEGACVGGGDTTFDEFLTTLNPTDFGDDHWRNNPDRAEIKRSESLRPVNRGGEPHTFTPVAAFGAGCVAELNAPLGLTGPPAADCATSLAPSAILFPGRSQTLSNLTPGVHRYQCMIHPWMRSTITVR